ncbi:hypothetical protein [uncultured Polaribacter sp.]|uniref:hypothetical protein n=1 Tax=uncultured Polaribacter sp. TaxID=174711 RepID=UPI0026053511|nr:hypothetical protein [uncultured Polaribacter sp.]
MKKITTFIFVLLSISMFSQSPWTQEKGKIYTQLSFTTISNYNTLFGDPEYILQRNVTDNTMQFYGEYGLTSKTTLIVNLPLKLINTEGFNNNANDIITSTKEASETALGNIEIGLKHNFYKKDWLLSGQLSIEANTGNFDAETGIRTGYDAVTFTPLFLAGRGYKDAYLQTFIGANIRTNNYSANFKVGGEYGKKITEQIWLIGFIDIVKSLENGDINLPATNTLTGLYVNDQEYGAFGFKGIYEVTESFGVNSSFGGAFFGNNVAKQAALTFGLYHKF